MYVPLKSSDLKFCYGYIKYFKADMTWNLNSVSIPLWFQVKVYCIVLTTIVSLANSLELLAVTEIKIVEDADPLRLFFSLKFIHHLNPIGFWAGYNIYNIIRIRIEYNKI